MAEERRNKTRTVKSGTQTVHVTYLARPNYEQTVPCKLIDLSEEGCGLRCDVALPAGLLVRVTGDLRGEGRPVMLEGKVAWSRPAAPPGRGTLLGVTYSRPAAKPSAAAKDFGPPPPPKSEQPQEERPDYYELLQLSANADADTVHRVYRMLAQRYHPDNTTSGNQEMFRRVLEAYQVLSDPERRAKYDVDYRLLKRLQWRIFDQPTAAAGVEGERAKRRGVLALLYTKRRNMPDQPAMGLVEIEEMLGVPRDHLEFTLWYLKEAGLVVRSDNARYIITIKGVDHAEESGSWSPTVNNDRLLESPEAIARRAAAG